MRGWKWRGEETERKKGETMSAKRKLLEEEVIDSKEEELQLKSEM